MTLVIQTSTSTVRVGLADGGRLVAQDEFPADRQLAETLAQRIAELAQRVSVQPYEPAREKTNSHTSTLPRLHALRKIIVHAGPGGYSALRVGITTANTLAYALNIPVVPVAGEIVDLRDLLEKGKSAPPAPENLAVPVYAKPPKIGPIPTP